MNKLTDKFTDKAQNTDKITLKSKAQVKVE